MQEAPGQHCIPNPDFPKEILDEPFGHALRVVSLAGGIQLGGFQRIGRRVLGIFHGVVHRGGRKLRFSLKKKGDQVIRDSGALAGMRVTVAQGLLSGMTTDPILDPQQPKATASSPEWEDVRCSGRENGFE